MEVRAEEAPSAAEAGYTLQVTALTGPKGADVTLDVESRSGGTVDVLKKVKLKIYAVDGSLAAVRNFMDVAAPDGAATIEIGDVERNRQIRAEVLIQTEESTRAAVVRGQTVTRLRPDLVVAEVDAPAQTLTTRPIDVVAEIAELNGDTGAQATVTLLWGPSPLAEQQVDVSEGGSASFTFSDIELPTAAPIELSVRVDAVTPAETDTTNNALRRTVDVTEHELAPSLVFVPSLGGYGAQMNGHVYAGVLPAPPGSMPDLEAKVKALEPQLVRIFFSEEQEVIPARMESFVKTVELAHEAGATINITYQSAVRAKRDPALFMGQFAGVLEDLVRNRGAANVRWVTIQNEPNRTQLTLAEYELLYRTLHDLLVARGLDDHIKLMGGDLVEFGAGPNPDHQTWWNYMAAHMNDVLDAYSVHIYWNYWDLERMEFRLKDVRRIVMEELPEEARKPVYVTEFGVRGILNFPGKPAFQPGYWEDGTPTARTNIAAFQQLWFSVAASQMGYAGVVKWDAYWGKYDSSYNASHYLIGPPEEGWPLFPAYHAFRMLLQTTQRGWQVLGVAPWLDDDWKLGEDGQPNEQPEKEIVAYSGPRGELTLVGFDTHARALNATSTETPAYSIGGLPPSATFSLVLWNETGTGVNSVPRTVIANAAGVARFDVPLHAAFALTTVPVS